MRDFRDRLNTPNPGQPPAWFTCGFFLAVPIAFVLLTCAVVSAVAGTVWVVRKAAGG